MNGSLKRELPLPLSQAEPYEGGMLGYSGGARTFVASRQVIKNDHRLYWVMVKVLSERYGCFISAKQKRGEETWIQCRDGRQVLFWQDLDRKWIQFQARQFDREGFEIAVVKHQIVRLGKVASNIAPSTGARVN